MNPKVAEKLVSGRLWLVFITGIVFGYATFAKILSAEAVATIITAVYVSYFGRSDRKTENNVPK